MSGASKQRYFGFGVIVRAVRKLECKSGKRKAGPFYTYEGYWVVRTFQFIPAYTRCLQTEEFTPQPDA